MPVEVAPMAHYHMGGIAVNERLETRVAGLFAAGEAVGGANGANRLSGNAITEALVFGERAGFFAARTATDSVAEWSPKYADRARAELAAVRQRNGNGPSPGAIQNSIQDLMWNNAGPFRSREKLQEALATLGAYREQLDDLTISPGDVFNMDLQDWYELRAMLRTAEALVVAALNREESRGAHQRLDVPQTLAAFERNQLLSLAGGDLTSHWTSVNRSGARSR
jgi:succinate dehydrogenase/fumarate reductase flavoprotein subunit